MKVIALKIHKECTKNPSTPQINIKWDISSKVFEAARNWTQINGTKSLAPYNQTFKTHKRYFFHPLREISLISNIILQKYGYSRNMLYINFEIYKTNRYLFCMSSEAETKSCLKHIFITSSTSCLDSSFMSRICKLKKVINGHAQHPFTSKYKKQCKCRKDS